MVCLTQQTQTTAAFPNHIEVISKSRHCELAQNQVPALPFGPPAGLSGLAITSRPHSGRTHPAWYPRAACVVDTRRNLELRSPDLDLEDLVPQAASLGLAQGTRSIQLHRRVQLRRIIGQAGKASTACYMATSALALLPSLHAGASPFAAFVAWLSTPSLEQFYQCQSGPRPSLVQYRRG